ncbi:diacylglycerol kinase family protein [Candidatus Pacearchaeota archaeon]|nr:diacylglycerol kinase family protein [Candidatus Pacearchaeota archaeon]
MKLVDFIRNRIESFRYAVAGFKDIVRTEHNALVHAVCTIVVLLTSVWLRVSSVEFAIILIVISLVWLAEAFNTVLEIVIDIVSPEYTDAAKRAKDIAAAAVLFAAIGAFMIGVIVLGPPLVLRIFS